MWQTCVLLDFIMADLCYCSVVARLASGRQALSTGMHNLSTLDQCLFLLAGIFDQWQENCSADARLCQNSRGAPAKVHGSAPAKFHGSAAQQMAAVLRMCCRALMVFQ
jgi:hypothetical protein